MKKIILSVALIATAAIAGWNYQQNKQSVELSDLAMENIEALADNENSDVNCTSSTNDWCSFVVSTPSGNWIETHPNATERP